MVVIFMMSHSNWKTRAKTLQAMSHVHSDILHLPVLLPRTDCISASSLNTCVTL